MQKRMKLRVRAILPAIALMAGMASCGYDGKKAAADRQEWVESLKDSITIMTSKYTADSVALIEARQRVATDIQEFTTIDNPHEVEAYYLYTPAKALYPLKSTGVAARVMRNEGYELIAASKSRFSAIRISTPSGVVESDVVPADQALNYTANGLTTVAFTGARADSIGMLVNNTAEDDAIKVEYLNPTVTASWTMTPELRKMISETWQLCDAQKRTHLLEKALSTGSRKIEILRMTIAGEE